MEEQFLDLVCDLFGNEPDVEAARLMNVPLTRVKDYLQDARYLEDDESAMNQFMSGPEVEVEENASDHAPSAPLLLSKSALASVVNALKNVTQSDATEATQNNSTVSHVRNEENPELITEAVPTQERPSARLGTGPEVLRCDDPNQVNNAKPANIPRGLLAGGDDQVMVVPSGANIITIEKNRNFTRRRGSKRKTMSSTPPTKTSPSMENLGARVIWRPTEEFYNKLCTKLSEIDFWLSFHVSRSTVETMLLDMAPHYPITDIHLYPRPGQPKSTTHRSYLSRRPLTSLILVSLWMLKTSELIQDISSRFHLAKGSIHDAIAIFCKLTKNTYGHVIAWPCAKEMDEIEAGFRQQVGISDVIGVMGTMTQRVQLNHENTKYISASLKSGEDLRYGRCCVKHFVVCDHLMRIRSVHGSSPGSLNDAQVLAGTSLWSQIRDSPERVLPGQKVLVGGVGFPLTEKVIRCPWPGENLERPMRRLRTRLKKADSVVQECLGFLRARWPRLACSNLRRINRMADIFHACCILHNLALQLEGDQALGGLTVTEPGVQPSPVACFTYDDDLGRRDRLADSLVQKRLSYTLEVHSEADG